MATKLATAVKATSTSDQRSERRALCQELLGLRRKYTVALAQMEDLKQSLIALATKADEGSFREVFADQGIVTVAGCKDREFKSHKPEVDPRVFDNLSEAKRRRLLDDGIIKIVAVYSNAYYGRCTVKLV